MRPNPTTLLNIYNIVKLYISSGLDNIFDSIKRIGLPCKGILILQNKSTLF